MFSVPKFGKKFKEFFTYLVPTTQPVNHTYFIVSYQLMLIKVRTESLNLNDCAVPFLSHAAVNLCWYFYIYIYIFIYYK